MRLLVVLEKLHVIIYHYYIYADESDYLMADLDESNNKDKIISNTYDFFFKSDKKNFLLLFF